MGRKIIIAITGASGSIYAKRLLDKIQNLINQTDTCDLVFSSTAHKIWEYELGTTPESLSDQFTIYDKNDFFAPFASGSAKYGTLIICPCSMGTLARIASGISNDLITRAADVILKERRKLILIPRDTPYSLIHINNMKTLTEAGAIICAASPSFYSNPKTFEELAATVIDRVIDLVGLEQDTYRWGK